MAVWLSLSLSQGTPNVTARTNTVTASVKVHYSDGSFNGNSPSGTLTINGQSFSFTCNFNYAGIGQGAASTGTGSVTACTRTVTVSYGSSSTKTVSASASFASGTGSGTVSASDSISLTPISSGGGSGGGDDDDDNTEEWDPDNPGGGSGGIVVTPGNATVVGQALLTSNEPYYQTETYTPIYCGALSCTCAIKITTPGFVGTSQSLDVDLYAINAWSSDDLLMCYALCDSDENHRLYMGAQSVVNDPSQIVCGTLSRAEWGLPFSIQTDKLVGNKDYYLFLWLPSDLGLTDSADLGVATSHSVNLNYIADEGGGDSGEDPENPDNTEYRYLWIQKPEGTNVYVGVYQSTDNYVDVSDTAEERSGDTGLWYVYTFQKGNYFRFNIVALPGYTLGEISTVGLNYDEEHNDYTIDSPNNYAYVWVEAFSVPGNMKGTFYIDNGTSFDKYQLYFDTGVEWVPINTSGSSGSYTRDASTLKTLSGDEGLIIDCGFKPDLVMLHRSETYEDYTCSCAAVFDADMDRVNTAVWSVSYDQWLDMYIVREDTGFTVYAYLEDDDTESSAVEFNYVAIKYT